MDMDSPICGCQIPTSETLRNVETDTRYQIFLAKMSGLPKVKTRVKLEPDFIAKLCNKRKSKGWSPPPSFTAERVNATYYSATMYAVGSCKCKFRRSFAVFQRIFVGGPFWLKPLAGSFEL